MFFFLIFGMLNLYKLKKKKKKECSSSQFDVLRDEEIPVILIDIVGSILELIARSMRSEMVISASVAFVRTIASVVQNEVNVLVSI